MSMAKLRNHSMGIVLGDTALSTPLRIQHMSRKLNKCLVRGFRTAENEAGVDIYFSYISMNVIFTKLPGFTLCELMFDLQVTLLVQAPGTGFGTTSLLRRLCQANSRAFAG